MFVGQISSRLRRRKLLKSLQGSKATPFLTYMLTAVAVMGGFLFGYNTAVVSGALVIIRNDPETISDVDDLWQSLLVALTSGVAAIFALISGWVNEVFGRRPGMIISAILFTIGPIVCGVAESRDVLLVGRVIIGVAIGFASAGVPHYIAECAPQHIRGRLIAQFQLFITFGILIASICGAAFNNLSKPESWKFMLGLPATVAFIQLIGISFMPESPRWLATHNRTAESQNVLLRITANTDVANVEFDYIMETHAENLAERASSGSHNLVITMLKDSSIRKALVLSGLLQMFQQLSGVNIVMYYSTTVIIMGGVSPDLALWYSCIPSTVNFVATFMGLYLIEKIGRKKLLLVSNLLVVVCLLIMGGAFTYIESQSTQLMSNHTKVHDPTFSGVHCFHANNCDECSYKPGCGFCYDSALNVGRCMNASHVDTDAHCDSHLGIGTNSTMTVGYCPANKVSWLPIVGMVLYCCSFSIGFGPVPWTLAAETFPNFCRSAGNAFATSVNWLFNLIVSLSFLQLTVTIHRPGAFFLYAATSFLGLLVFWVILPETKGQQLEILSLLLKEPWCSNVGTWKRLDTWRKWSSASLKSLRSLKRGLSRQPRTEPKRESESDAHDAVTTF